MEVYGTFKKREMLDLIFCVTHNSFVLKRKQNKLYIIKQLYFMRAGTIMSQGKLE
jgi:hypothetical protein